MIVAIKSRSQCGGVGRSFVERVKQMVLARRIRAIIAVYGRRAESDVAGCYNQAEDESGLTGGVLIGFGPADEVAGSSCLSFA